MKKLLIIGASVLQLPAILKAKEMGFHVGVVDINPEAVGIKYADEFFNVSTNDKEGVLEVARKMKVDGIMTLATDMPMRTIAYVAEKINIPGISQRTALLATDKGEMIKIFKQKNVACPWFFLIESAEDLEEVRPLLKFPCILKPTESSGSRGVNLVQNNNSLLEAYKYSNQVLPGRPVIIEEYLEGNEVSVEVIAVNGNPHVLAITDKVTTGSPHFVEMGHSQPSGLNDNELKKISQLAVDAVNAIELENGPAHVEIMSTSSGPKMIEIGARMGGDNITTHLVPLSTGIDMVKATIELAVGEKPDLTPKFNNGSAIRYFNVREGIICNILGVDEALEMKGVKEVVLTKNVGEKVTHFQSSTDRVGYVIAQGKDAKVAVERCNRAIQRISFSIT